MCRLFRRSTSTHQWSWGPWSSTRDAVTRLMRQHSRGIVVLQKCANPVCDAQFRYLHQGKLFEVEIQYSDRPRPNDQREPSNGNVHVERWWLCAGCAVNTTVGFNRQQGLVMVHSLEGWDQVVATAFPQSSRRALAEIEWGLIRPLDLTIRRKADSESKVETRKIA